MSALPPYFVPPAFSAAPFALAEPDICVDAPGVQRTEQSHVARRKSDQAGPVSTLRAVEGVDHQVSTFTVLPRQPAAPRACLPPPPSTRYVPTLSSPLRQAWSPAPRQTAHQLVQMGDARYAAERCAERAIFYWLAAHLEGEDQRAAAYSARICQVAGGNVALNLFHVAHLAPSARHARLALRGAVKLNASMLDLMDTLLVRAGAHPSFGAVHRRLERNFAALLPESAKLQKQLLTSLRAGAWDAARPLADQLIGKLPHLLVPRCARFLCDASQNGDPRQPAAFGETFNPAYAAGEVLRFVLDLDADGHEQAMGATSEQEYRWVWRSYLDRFFVAAPAMFVGHLAAGDVPQQVPASRRQLCGLDWSAALALPLPRSWREQVGCVQIHKREQDLVDDWTDLTA